MALLAPSPRVLRVREAPAAATAGALQAPAAACSTVAGGGGAAGSGRPLGLWRDGGGKGRRRRRERGDGMKAEAYFWDVSRPVEMEEIDSMDKLDDALRWSVENKQPIIIDWTRGRGRDSWEMKRKRVIPYRHYSPTTPPLTSHQLGIIDISYHSIN
ncbi:hypothetical protein E2562_002588 [Oryza meyeriana var. granulata]|uniref:Uncharacterized protein n=1 Tax=Oryza meyeriana var. granulata TaxID=110450 RepID=A0A6G1F2W9_9ORYZ|nr:hypothetical protein E2562_002588 [Oryza meyeriana var. granulata]